MRNLWGVLAAMAVVGGPALAYLRVAPAMIGFVIFALGGIVSVIVGVVSLVQLVRGHGLTVGGGLAALIGLAFVAIASRGAGHPSINDFTTDPVDPPAFALAASLPENVGRGLGYPQEFAAIQRECCADLRAAKLAAPPRQAYERALEVAAGMPAWHVINADGMKLVIEAIVTSRVFGFVDDVVIRVRPEPDGSSRVDMRSKSRDGKGDIGANSVRIREYVERLEAKR